MTLSVNRSTCRLLRTLHASKIEYLASPCRRAEPFAEKQFVDEFRRSARIVCGNLALATGAWGGVYLCGSVVSIWLNADRTSSFVLRLPKQRPNV